MQATPTNPSNRRAPRGNTIVLVTAILVLLVIIATAFVSRTRAVRQTSAAQQASAGRDGRAESIGLNVAQEIANALFVKPIDTADPFTKTDSSVTPPVIVGSSSWPRLASPLDTPRYSVDPRDNEPVNPGDLNDRGPGNGLPDLGYNFAPYEVKAWTNWPDFFGNNSPWPFGPGSPNGQVIDANGQPLADGNPYGNPGFGDTRWLRSTEPERVGVDQSGDGVPDLFTFSHWSHLSWLPTANNGWRVVADISDINLNTVSNLNEAGAAPYAVAFPYEQWLPGIFPAPIQNATQFQNRLQAWFFNYQSSYIDPAVALPNFFQLKALGKPTDEFKPGTLRNVISRTFTDTDGDGFTDSYWFVAPVGTERSIRTLVGVSVVDNSALLNANIATKFSFDTTTGATPSDLALVTSLAEFAVPTAPKDNVGFFDASMNQGLIQNAFAPAIIQDPPNAQVASNTIPSPQPTYWTGLPRLGFAGVQPPQGVTTFIRSRYGDVPPFDKPLSYLQAIGMRTPTGFPDSGSYTFGLPLVDQTLPQGIPQGTFESAAERLAWFKIIGGDPEQPRFGLTPFDAADEFELRAFHGNNMGGTISRFEQAVNIFSPGLYGANANDFQFLRSTVQREESDEYIDQLDARQLVVDNRRKLTMYSGARNETMPPGLWLTPLYDESTNYLNPGGNVPPTADPNYAAFQAANFAEWDRQKLKVDLREPTFVDDAGNPAIPRNPLAAFQWRRDIQRLLEKTLTYQGTDSLGAALYKSYYGTRPEDFRRTRSMIASYVANLDCASDEATTLLTTGVAIDGPLYPNAPQADPQGYLPPRTDAVPDPYDQNRFYVGMEKQPFIMEVFFGLVYPRSDFNENEWNQAIQASGGSGTVPATVSLPDGPLGVDDGGENFVDSSSKPTSVIAVQIANPYDTPISLGDFRLEFYGRTFNFTAGSIVAGYGPNPVLPAATLGKPSTAIVYAVEAGAVGPYPAGAFRSAILDFFDLEKGEWQGSTSQQVDADADGQIEYATLYDSQGNLQNPPGSASYQDPLDRTLVFDATASWQVNDVNAPGEPNAQNTRYTNTSTQPVQIIRNILPPAGVNGGPRQIVVDRFDNDQTGPNVDFNEATNRLFTDPQFIPPQKNYTWDPSPARRFISGIRLRENEMYMTWCRASRIWAWDVDSWDDASVPIEQKRISATERSPRYVFSMATEPVRADRQWEGVTYAGGRLSGPQGYKGNCWKVSDDPDGDAAGQNRWVDYTFMDIFGRQLRGKPVFFSNQVVTTPNGTEVISSLGPGTPMPFIPKLGLPPGSGSVFTQDCHGIANINGQDYEWQTGNKGARPSDWQRFKQILTAQIPFQMTQKDSDFEQIGEVLDVFLWGHVFDGWGGNPTTVRTFSETMLDDDVDSPYFPGAGLYINRLWVRAPGDIDANDPGTPVVNARFDALSTATPPAGLPGYKPWEPSLPMGIGFLDGLTIDGPGRNSFDRNSNGQIDGFQAQNLLTDSALAEQRSYRLAGGYAGKSTAGLININTALPEVMQALPMMTRLPKAPSNGAPYAHYIDAMRSYRDRWTFRGTGLAGAPTPYNTNLQPTYADRGLTANQITSAGLGAALPANLPRFFPSMRNERGIASIGELLLLNRAPDASVPAGLAASYTSRWMGYDPYADYPQGGFGDYDVGYSWATDRTNPRPRQLPADIFASITPPTEVNVPFKEHEEPLGDAEDLTLVFKGISNLVTTRSDVFTVYLKVRQVKQNDQTGIWDGTNRDLIVDEARYVMCVDRSNCDSPDDQPKIVYFQKCP